MKRMCRRIATTTWRRRQLAVTELLRNARVVSDPVKIASLKAKVARRDGNALHIKCEPCC